MNIRQGLFSRRFHTSNIFIFEKKRRKNQRPFIKRNMEKIITEEKQFEQIDFTTTALPVGDYENCSFTNCHFSNGNLSSINFTDCSFNSCNLSMAILAKTAFRDCNFKDSKLLGLHFEHCNEFGLSVAFDNCLLNLSSFYQRKLKQTMFKNSSLQEVDFTSSDLSGSTFDNCDLSGATFENCMLENADFRTAYNYAIDPEINRLKKAKFSIAELPGLLNKYSIDVY
jgi:fluoroquinolone resistance protein